MIDPDPTSCPPGEHGDRHPIGEVGLSDGFIFVSGHRRVGGITMELARSHSRGREHRAVALDVWETLTYGAKDANQTFTLDLQILIGVKH
jgi:hypothetical protein